MYDVTDLLGSERMAVNQVGTILAEYEYDPYGTRSKVSGTGPDSERGFGGLWYDASSGLQFSQTRAYDAQIGRWLTRDPLGNGQAFQTRARFNATNFNLYAYTANNALSMVDPNGMHYAPIGNNVWVGEAREALSSDSQYYALAAESSDPPEAMWNGFVSDSMAVASLALSLIPEQPSALSMLTPEAGIFYDVPVAIESVLEGATEWLGEGYTQIAPGIYRSSDGLRQFRMRDSDILGFHGGRGPHVHFETIGADGEVRTEHVPICK
jgi:RHS repeat-associated protein